MVERVCNYYQTQQYPQIQQDYADVHKYSDKTENGNKTVFGNVNVTNSAQAELNPVFSAAAAPAQTSPIQKSVNPFNPSPANEITPACVFQALPPVRRVSSLSDKIKNGDIASALGLAALMVINFPEDCRDINTAFKQLTQKGYQPSYNYKELQHPFSFFKGTLLHKFVDPNTTKHPKLAFKLRKADITMDKTIFGQKILRVLNTEAIDSVKTKIKSIGHTEANPKFVKAAVYKGNAFGKLTARAMNRTTLIGTAAIALLEVPKIFKAMDEGKTIGEQAGNTFTQVIKSGINLASITAGIAYGGAIGAKYAGATGSLIGMGAGAIFGSLTSRKVQEVIA